MMATISTLINPKLKCLLLIWYWTLATNLVTQAASQSHNCSHVKCPPLSQIRCPEDSYVREIKEESNLLSTSDNYEIVEEIFVHCCVTQKCSCRVCHIPSCYNTSLVLMETIPETETPGKCCGKYDCIFEPNCTEIINSNGLHWLTDCQRCECISGGRICHRSCDETLMPPQNCISPNLNRFFSNGDRWKEDSCTICECHNGKNNCQASFCSPLYCTKTIKVPGECCPVCVDDKENIANVIIVTTELTTTNVLPTIENDFEPISTDERIADTIMQNSTTISSSTKENIIDTTIASKYKPLEVSTTTIINDNHEKYDQIDEIHIFVTEQPQPSVKRPLLPNEKSSASPTQVYHQPCTTKEPPVTYSIENSDTVRIIQPPVPQYCYFYVVITILSVLLILFIVLYIHERSKKRSYDPVPSTDDNFNKITTKIKAIECP